MRVLAAALISAALCGVVATFSGKAFGATSGACALTPIMMENFDALSINSSRIGPARWIAHTPWAGDFGDARFADSGTGGPFRLVPGGGLVITASKDGSGRWTSGLIAAADSDGVGTGTRYGYFEARMRLPPGPGTWPAFWLSALKPVTAKDGNVEIDVVEYYGQFDSLFHNVVHVWYSDPARVRGEERVQQVKPGALVSSFHTYGVDISPAFIVFFLDRKETWRVATPSELTTPMYPLVNLALGSGWPIDQTPNPSSMVVDYVHVYHREAGPPEGCAPGLPETK
jgi:hypothetical protein